MAAKELSPNFSWGYCYTESCGLSFDTHSVFPQFCDCSALPFSLQTVLLSVTPQLLRGKQTLREAAANSCSQMKNNSKRKKTKVPQSALHCSITQTQIPLNLSFPFLLLQEILHSQPEEWEFLHGWPLRNNMCNCGSHLELTVDNPYC